MTRALDWLPALEGWRWVLAWVVVSVVPVLLVIAGVLSLYNSVPGVGAIRQDGAAGYFLTLVRVAVATLVVAGTGAAGQSVMLLAWSVPARAWIMHSALGATAVAVVGAGVVSFVFRMTGEFGPGPLGATLQVVSLLQTTLAALLVGGTQARLLGGAVEGAWRWVAIVLVTGLATRGVSQGVISLRQELPPVFFAVPMLFSAVVLGVGMRWLLTRGRSRLVVQPAV